jgi:hypothetical protein
MSKSSPQDNRNTRNGIGTLNEFSLHAEIIQHLAQKDDQLEAKLEGYYIDILRGNQIIEVQTTHLAKLKPKIKKLRNTHDFEIIYPIQSKKTIIKIAADGEIVSKRVSPKKGKIEHLFDEMVHAPSLIDHTKVSLTVLLIEAEEIWRDDGKGSWRRKFWSISERHLSKIVESVHFSNNQDFLQLLPKSLPSPFTNKQLAEQLRIRGRLAGKITYTLRKMGILQIVDKKGNAYLFSTM